MIEAGQVNMGPLRVLTVELTGCGLRGRLLEILLSSHRARIEGQTSKDHYGLKQGTEFKKTTQFAWSVIHPQFDSNQHLTSP